MYVIKKPINIIDVMNLRPCQDGLKKATLLAKCCHVSLDNNLNPNQLNFMMKHKHWSSEWTSWLTDKGFIQPRVPVFDKNKCYIAFCARNLYSPLLLKACDFKQGADRKYHWCVMNSAHDLSYRNTEYDNIHAALSSHFIRKDYIIYSGRNVFEAMEQLEENKIILPEECE
jgi:hypothetical protein